MQVITPQEAARKIDALRKAQEHGEDAERAILDAYPDLPTKLGLRLLDLAAQTRWKTDQAIGHLEEFAHDDSPEAV